MLALFWLTWVKKQFSRLKREAASQRRLAGQGVVFGRWPWNGVHTNNFSIFGVEGSLLLEIDSAPDNIAFAVQWAVGVTTALTVVNIAVIAMISPSSRLPANHDAQLSVLLTEAHTKVAVIVWSV